MSFPLQKEAGVIISKHFYIVPLLCWASLTGCAHRAALEAATPEQLPGYLAKSDLPDSKAILPPAPNVDSKMQITDEAIYQQGQALRGSARWEMAARDANLHHFPSALGAFACAIGFMPSEAETPNLIVLLRRVKADAGSATHRAKEAYKRTRPFVVHKAETCEPSDEKRLSTQGSYPSGHTSAGIAWALVLAELMPEKKNAILQRGYAYGRSRSVCGYHWQSDVEAGIWVGAATVAALHANPDFHAQLEAARHEIIQKSATSSSVAPECAAEFQLLGGAL